MDRAVTFQARILRKQLGLPRYVVVKPEHLAGRERSFSADVFLNGHGPFARTIRPWGKGSDLFFFNLTEPQCRRAGVDTHDQCEVKIAPSLA